MEWQGRRKSGNVQDSRGRGGGGMGGGGGGGFGLLMTLGRVFGIKGIIAAVLIGGVLWKLGVLDPGMLVGSPAASSRQVEISPKEQQRFEFVEVILAQTEDVWTQEFARIGRNYVLPTLEVYRGQVRTACGSGSAAMGPFYCPGDEKVYIDLSFYDELAETFQSPGDFAQAYVIAHEIGHHVQKLLGISEKVAARRGQADYNEYSVRLELQADFFAGVWAKHSQADLKLDDSDIQEALRAANAIGDDMIQKRTRGRVKPEAFTHGTAEQRMRWFNKGFRSGRIEDGDTFSMPYREL